MITIDALKEYGANVDEGLSRCMNNEALFLKLVAIIPGEPNFNKLKEAVFQLGDTIGQKLLPHITPIVEKLTDWIDSLSELDDETWDNILKLMGYAAVFGPVIGAIGNGLIWTAKLKDAFGILKGAEGVAGAPLKLS